MLIQSEIWTTDLIESHVWFPVGSTFAVTADLTADLSGDFTLIGWFKGIGVADFPFALWDIGSLEVELTLDSDYELRITDTNGVATEVIDWSLTDWNCITVIRSGTTITVYLAKTLLMTYVSAPLLNYGDSLRMVSAEASVFDLRVIPRAIALEDLAYYYDNITLHEGDAVLPGF